ncbi:hypothetical protein [Aliiruegeria sabulilitoris]|uniref:hypothetical protein n=1 Tax=Aliiruegeria sabulilitoris TaxID=1510458 RepID=UPI0008350F4A|nr:hypothetical protein [Aliiruegeria sabulilitoris]NDR58169.1 hypothetical protein [Pseudoruegeria sp. M32A2M]
MIAEHKLAAERPDPDASAHPTLRVFQPGDTVMTRAGELPVERLRPGDRVVMETLEAGCAVQWMELRRCRTSGRLRIQVMFGRQAHRKTAPTALPVGGRVSSKTGKLQLDAGYASAAVAGKRVH